ncbi:MAG: YfhO family protein, partial [Lachnospiraceae bacterium]|nr:YfhO family protein [Lachnospiraceae bacterium]
QHYTSLVYIGKWGRDILQTIWNHHTFKIPLWDFSIGYGSDIITTLHYYVLGDPLNLLSILVPPKFTEYLYGGLILFRIYLAGISFSLYCFSMKKGKTATLFGTISYIFCGYMLFSAVRHPFFINPMIYLPLLLIGAERIFQRKSPALFIGMVSLSAISNFYFFYMLVFAVCFYVGIRFFTFPHLHPIKELFSVIGCFFCYALPGICMSAFLLLPVLMQFLGTNRTKTEQLSSSFYEPSYYLNCIFSFTSTKRIGNWTCLGFTVIALLALIFLFSSRKKYTALKVAFLIQSGMLCIPFFGKALNGFSYVSNRWCFIYSGLVSYIVATILNDRTSYFRTSAVWKKSRAQRIFTACLLLVMCFNLALNGYYLFHPNGQDYASHFVDFGKAFDTVQTTAPKAVLQKASSDDSFFRFELDDNISLNTAALFGINGTQYYWSLENHNISDYLMDLSLNRLRVFKYKNIDHRTFPNALASVKYIAQSDSNVLPYGYTKYDTVTFPQGTSYELYKNSYTLPLGYTYTSYLSQKDYRNMSPELRQEALLQGILLEDQDIETLASSYPKTKASFTSQSIDYTIKNITDIELLSDGGFEVKKAGASLTLHFSGLPKSETYLSFRGANFSAKNQIGKKFILKIASNESKNKLEYLSPYYKYYSGQKNFLVHLGYHKNPQSDITITFPKKGSYHFKDLQVICQPMKNYKEHIQKLRETSLKQEEIGTNSVKGSIQLSQDKILCLSIPYSKGWTAMVDGKKTPLFKANVMYMALPLRAGSHKIELSYHTPGLKLGVYISCVGFVIFLIILYRNRSRTLTLDSMD